MFSPAVDGLFYPADFYNIYPESILIHLQIQACICKIVLELTISIDHVRGPALLVIYYMLFATVYNMSSDKITNQG
jgi:hypothetical protein